MVRLVMQSNRHAGGEPPLGGWEMEVGRRRYRRSIGRRGSVEKGVWRMLTIIRREPLASRA